MNKYTESQLHWMHTHLDRSFCEVVDGVMTNLQTGDIIPVDLHSYQQMPPDGQRTCFHCFLHPMMIEVK